MRTKITVTVSDHPATSMEAILQLLRARIPLRS
jgi:hypothetical protein